MHSTPVRLAEQILQRAQANGVRVHASPEVFPLLMQVDLDRRIPPQLYRAVAEVLAWLHRLEPARGASAKN